MYLVSACLAGKNCKYNGKNNEVEEIVSLYKEGKAILVCPEELGGLPTPRIPSERYKESVINKEGKDVTDAFVKGSELAMEIAKKHGCTTCILKKNSPSCSIKYCYDGSFSHTLVKRPGVFGEMCIKEGFVVLDEDDYAEQFTGLIKQGKLVK